MKCPGCERRLPRRTRRDRKAPLLLTASPGRRRLGSCWITSTRTRCSDLILSPKTLRTSTKLTKTTPTKEASTRIPKPMRFRPKKIKIRVRATPWVPRHPRPKPRRTSPTVKRTIQSRRIPRASLRQSRPETQPLRMRRRTAPRRFGHPSRMTT